MTTLSAHEIIPAGVALRLHRQYFGIDHAAAARAERPALDRAGDAQQAAHPASKRDEHAAMADCAALADYLEAHGSIDLTVRESRDVVPWAYRRYRGQPPAEAVATSDAIKILPHGVLVERHLTRLTAAAAEVLDLALRVALSDGANHIDVEHITRAAWLRSERTAA